MFNGTRIACIATTFWICGVSTLAAAPKQNVSAAQPIPSLIEVKKAVADYFAKDPEYRPGDLITSDQVKPLLQQLQQQGLPLADADEILAATVGPDEFLTQQLRTPNGMRFMRRIAKLNDGYDRVDRLIRLPQGRQTVLALIANPRGDQLIEYMITTPGGKELGRMLSQDPRGTNFNRITGRIYTASLLLDRLAQSRDRAMKAAEKRGNP